MRVRLACLVLGALLVPILAQADGHSADFAAAYSASSGGSTLHGIQTTFAKSLGPLGPCALGATLVDVGFQIGEHEGRDLTHVFYMAGPRVTCKNSDEGRHLVHAQFLAGGAHSNDGRAGPNDGALSLGVAYEFAAGGPSGRTRHKGLGGRAQVERIWRKGDGREAVTRFSVAAVYRFPETTP